MGKRAKWKQWEIDYLKENFGKIKVEKIVKKLKFSMSKIYNKACKLGLKNSKRFWKQKEVDYLRKNYPKFPVKKIAKKLKCSISSVCNKAYKLKLRSAYKRKSPFKNKTWEERYGTKEARKKRKNHSLIRKNKTWEKIFGEAKAKKLKKEKKQKSINMWKSPKYRKSYSIMTNKYWKSQKSENHRKKVGKKSKKWWKSLNKKDKKIMCQKISVSLRGKPKIYMRGEKNILGMRTKNKTYEELYGEDKAQRMRHRCYLNSRGKNNYFYKNGKSKEPYSIEFNKHLRNQIRKRDKICRICKKFRQNKRKLAVHHIDGNKKNNNPQNLICLCVYHHSKTMLFYEDMQDYFKLDLQNRGFLSHS